MGHSCIRYTRHTHVSIGPSIHPSIRYIAARIDDRLQCKLRNEYLGTNSSLVGPMRPANNSEVFNPSLQSAAAHRHTSCSSVLTLSTHACKQIDHRCILQDFVNKLLLRGEIRFPIKGNNNCVLPRAETTMYTI